MQLSVGSLHSTEASRVEESSRETEVEGRMKLRWLDVASTRRSTTVEECGLIRSTRYSRSSRMWTMSPGLITATLPLQVYRGDPDERLVGNLKQKKIRTFHNLLLKKGGARGEQKETSLWC